MMRAVFLRTSRRYINTLSNWSQNQDGNISILAAVCAFIVMALAALVVDISALFLEHRKSQNVTDLAAILLAKNPDTIELEAGLILQDNGIASAQILVDDFDGYEEVIVNKDSVSVLLERGHYKRQRDIAVNARFTPGQTPTNAVRVTLQKRGTLYFGEGFMDIHPVIKTQSVAYSTNEAAFSVGSRLASLNGGILNDTLGALLGTTISLSVMDYNALLQAEVEVLKIFDTIGGDLSLTAGTYNKVLDADVSFAQFATAMAQVGGVSASAQTALNRLASTPDIDALHVPLSQLFDLGTVGSTAWGQDVSPLEAKANAMDILVAAAALANGEHQVELDLGANLPGLVDVRASLAIGEPMQYAPWFAISHDDRIVRTAQTRLALEANIGGAGILSGVSVRLPIYVEVASAEAKLKNITCTGSDIKTAQVRVDARPGLADIWIADVDMDALASFGHPVQTTEAALVDTGLIRVDGEAHIDVGNTSFQTLVFNYSDIKSGNIKTVSTHNLSQSLVGSLLNEADLTVSVAGLGLGTGPLVKTAALSSLSQLTAPIDEALFTLLSTLGVRVGEADIRVHGVKCQKSVLVN